jgi:hypothetical protein
VLYTNAHVLPRHVTFYWNSMASAKTTAKNLRPSARPTSNPQCPGQGSALWDPKSAISGQGWGHFVAQKSAIFRTDIWGSFWGPALLSATVYASIIRLESLDLTKHDFGSFDHAQHIWPQFENSNHRKFSKFKAAESS